MVFSIIDEKLTCYDKGVILFGCGKAGVQANRVLDSFKKEVICFVDNNKEKWGSDCCSIPIKSLDEMLSILKENESAVIQIASEFSDDIEKQLWEMGVSKKRIISYWEFEARILDLSRYLYLKKNDVSIHDPVFTAELESYNGYRKGYTAKTILRNNLCNVSENIFINSAPKTGNTTLISSLKQAGISCYEGRQGYFTKIWDLLPFKNNKVKMILGVREPFLQLLSMIFEMQSNFWDQEDYWRDGGDVQKIFDRVIDKEVRNKKADEYYDIEKEFARQTRYVEKHFDEAVKNFFHIDVYNYPFDCEKGYTIIKQENIELFIFQLEKLSRLGNVLRDFLNIKDFVLRSDNVASEKWYNKYYQEAKKNLKIDRDLFNEVYSNKFMRHFYSEKQIDKFREKWEKNIL